LIIYNRLNMAKNSSIEWTHHTFNPWWGCTKVSPGCQHCYAEAWAKRVGQNVWGSNSDRRLFGDAHWEEPLHWNAEAEQDRIRRRVFCASMADVYEARPDLAAQRERLWTLITATPWLDWLLLTKRPQNIKRFSPWSTDWPENIWLGTTVENQKWAVERIPRLLRFPVVRRFLSCEPLLGPVDLSQWINDGHSLFPIDWVIAGGESGAHARAMLPGWARRLRDQCREADIPFHFKQWGHWAPARKRSELVKTFWDDVEGKMIDMESRGKKLAGRALDGIIWNEIPRAA
jgi:protein gp37